MNQQSDVVRAIALDICATFPDEMSEIVNRASDVDRSWEDTIDERQLKEVEFSLVYANEFKHGTAGHNQYMLIAALANRLDVYEELVQRLIEYIQSGRIS